MAPKLTEDEIDDLLYFARTGDQEEFEKLKDELCKREGINGVELIQAARDEESGNGVLHMAAANGYHALLQTFCKSLSQTGPQNPTMLQILNSQNKAGNTTLHWAALNGHLEAVKLLLEQGADPTIINQRGHDAIFEAELNDKREIVEWILKEGGEGLEMGLGGGEEGEGADEEGEEEAIDGESLTKQLEKEMKDIDIKDAEKNS